MRRLGTAISALVFAPVLALVLVVGFLPAASSAARIPTATASVTDEVGDAPAAIDLHSAVYKLNSRKAVIVVRLKRLSNRSILTFKITTYSEVWDRISVFRKKGKTVGRVQAVDGSSQFGEGNVVTNTKCPGLKVFWKAKKAKVRVVAPAKCLRTVSSSSDPHWMSSYSRFAGSSSARDKIPAAMLEY